MKERILQFLWLLVMVCLPVTAWAQGMVTATGTVIDANGDPMIGCTVQLKGSSVGTVTDLDGHFQLKVPEGKMLVLVLLATRQKK